MKGTARYQRAENAPNRVSPANPGPTTMNGTKSGP